MKAAKRDIYPSISALLCQTSLILAVLVGCTAELGPAPPVDNPDWEATMPAVSPDGLEVAFCRPFGGGNYRNQIWIYSVSTHSCNLFIEGESPTWHPNGRTLAFERGQEIWIIGRDRAGEVQVTKGGHWFSPDWSPAGRWLAFDRSLPPDSAGIWLCDVEGEFVLRRLWSGRHPSWSPDGQALVYSRHYYEGDTFGGGLFIYHLANNSEERVFFTEQYLLENPSWSPSGEAVAFSALGKLAVLDLTNRKVRILRCTGGWASFVDWLPSGEIIYSQDLLWVTDPFGFECRPFGCD